MGSCCGYLLDLLLLRLVIIIIIITIFHHVSRYVFHHPSGMTEG
jgi:TRAP-type C4-dicarboxylate transport system permease small subunit